MTYFQRRRIQQIEKAINKRDSLIKKDMDELRERFLLSKWTTVFSIAILVAAIVFALTALWSLF